MSNLQQPNSASLLIDGITFAWHYNGEYALRLIGDLTSEQMTRQPGGQANHPAWLLSHLVAYHTPILDMLEGKDAVYPGDHKFGKKSKPVDDPSVYPDKTQLTAEFRDGHARIEQALQNVDDTTLQRAMPMEGLKDRFPTVGSSLGYLMLYHESMHLGQLSAWRRVQGLPAV